MRLCRFEIIEWSNGRANIDTTGIVAQFMGGFSRVAPAWGEDLGRGLLTFPLEASVVWPAPGRSPHIRLAARAALAEPAQSVRRAGGTLSIHQRWLKGDRDANGEPRMVRDIDYTTIAYVELAAAVLFIGYLIIGWQ